MPRFAIFAGIIAVAGVAGIIGLSLQKDAPHPKAEMLNAYKMAFKKPENIPFPRWNPYTETKFNLGKELFFDNTLSGANDMSCASCHSPDKSWGDGRARAIGASHVELARRTPTLLNVAWQWQFFWDARTRPLWKQALGPITSKDEMNQDINELMDELKSHPSYPQKFAEAFPEDKPAITPMNLGKALATFERRIVSAPSRFDRWVAGDEGAMTDEEKEGFLVFNTKGRCLNCHNGWQFSDASIHLVGLESQRGRKFFKTPTLRNVVERGPYMHDGSMKTLAEVIQHYNESSQAQKPDLTDDRMPLVPINLTETEQKQLEAFLHSLSSGHLNLNVPYPGASVAGRFQ